MDDPVGVKKDIDEKYIWDEILYDADTKLFFRNRDYKNIYSSRDGIHWNSVKVDEQLIVKLVECKMKAIENEEERRQQPPTCRGCCSKHCVPHTEEELVYEHCCGDCDIHC